MFRSAVVAIFVCAAAQAGSWPTFGSDPQRTGVAHGEEVINLSNVGKMKLLWSTKLNNASIELNSLTAPVTVSGATTPHGFKDIVVVAGASDNVFAIDADTGKVMWSHTFEIADKPHQQPHWLCPNSLNATPTMDPRSRLVYVLATDGKLHTFNYISGDETAEPIQFVPPFAKAWSLNLYKNVLYTTTSQGCNGVKSAVYAMDLSKPDRPISKFVAGPTAGAGIWGRAGGAISSKTGLIYVETGDGPYDPASGKYADSFLAVSADGKLADYYTPANRYHVTHKDLDMGNMSPVVFPFKNWELVAGSGKEGRLFLLDATNLGGPDHKTPLYRSDLLTNAEVQFEGRGFWGALASWQDDDGTRWLYAPALGPATPSTKFPVTYGAATSGSIMAFKVVEKAGKPVLEPAWQSRDMAIPDPPVLANGVLFALSTGEDTAQVDSGGRILSSAARVKAPVGNATLYAFDAKTGKELFSSGKTMPGFSHFSGLAISAGRVYAVTYDNILYAFGVEE